VVLILCLSPNLPIPGYFSDRGRPAHLLDRRPAVSLNLPDTDLDQQPVVSLDRPNQDQDPYVLSSQPKPGSSSQPAEQRKKNVSLGRQ
jgi:hypothetical protein